MDQRLKPPASGRKARNKKGVRLIILFLLGSYFLCNWLIFRQNAIYLYLGKSKLGLMYQEVCYSNISGGIIKDMKADSRNKWRKVVSLSLDTSSTDTAIED